MKIDYDNEKNNDRDVYDADQQGPLVGLNPPPKQPLD